MGSKRVESAERVFLVNELDTVEIKLAFILHPPKGLIRRPFKK